VDGAVPVGERRPEEYGGLLHAVAIRREPGEWIVVDERVCQVLVGRLGTPFREEPCDESLDHRLVVL
jgi:hypothetical protein